MSSAAAPPQAPKATLANESEPVFQGWPFCPLRLPPPLPEDEDFNVELPNDCQTVSTKLTPCPGAAEVWANLQRCCERSGDDAAKCETTLSIGASSLVLAPERIGSNSDEGDFDYFDNKLEMVMLGHGVQVVARRYGHTSIGGHGSIDYILYAWDGSSIQIISNRRIKDYSGSQVFYEEVFEFEPRLDGVADIAIDSTGVTDNPEDPPSHEHLVLRFKDGEYR